MRNKSIHALLKKGVTLNELVVVLFIVSLIGLFAVPAFYELIQQYRYHNLVTRFVNDLHYTKNYANRYQTRISICASNGDGLCSAPEATDWSQGWIIFHDPNAQFALIQNTQIKSYTNTFKHMRITSSNNIKGGVNMNQYRRYGTARGSGLPNGQFFLCAPNQNPYTITLNVFGLIRYEKLDQRCPKHA